ncbi:MAG: hypothetical protein LBE35_08875 [Clostridiales bacterium]|jgi:hypothetical protein|nr:hypothetical protein [Clostridiales bacterium]
MIARENLLDEINLLKEEDYVKVAKFVDYLRNWRYVPESVLVARMGVADIWDSPEEDEAWKDL